jgi:hypothetical protein
LRNRLYVVGSRLPRRVNLVWSLFTQLRRPDVTAAANYEETHFCK